VARASVSWHGLLPRGTGILPVRPTGVSPVVFCSDAAMFRGTGIPSRGTDVSSRGTGVLPVRPTGVSPVVFLFRGRDVSWHGVPSRGTDVSSRGTGVSPVRPMGVSPMVFLFIAATPATPYTSVTRRRKQKPLRAKSCGVRWQSPEGTPTPLWLCRPAAKALALHCRCTRATRPLNRQ
jgi:hypothetical protein